MPGKHVHFALPSPSTLYSSSPGPETPPSLLPPHSSSRSNTHSKPPAPQLHPLLVCSAITWDLSLPPSTATTPYTSLSARPGLLSEPALVPPTPSLTLNPPTPSLTLRLLDSSWQILVRPRSNGAYITASDVLHAIYYGLRENVRSREFYGLGSRRDMRRVVEAYERRYKRAVDVEGERRAGMKRVDFLAERRGFAGLARLGPGFYMICVA